jgi:alcohol dehydrogenase (NADP+)
MEDFTHYIDPASVPKHKLASGDMIPAIGMGTFGSDNYDSQTIANAAREAVLMGYRHIDCASVYGNEKEIGTTLSELIHEGVVRRDELWITSKVWNDQHDDVIGACKQSMKDLKVDYLNLYLVHWPFPNSHAQGVSVDSRDPHARPYIHEEYMKVWQAMEQLVDEGLVRNIGTSNMTKGKLDMLLRDCRIKPACNEMELHPHFQQPELFDFVVRNGIQPIGFCPLGSPNRPERDKTPTDTNPFEDPTILKIAQAHGVHPALICIKWAVQRGQIPIPFSVKPPKLASNLRAAVEDPLTDEEMAAMKTVDKNCRLVKGQVFTWPGATWEDLWKDE